MKRIISISLLILVLLASSRLTVSAHYCAGELVSLEFNKSNAGCGKCGSTKKKHACCKDVSHVISSEDFNNKVIDFKFVQLVAVVSSVPELFKADSAVSSVLVKGSVLANAPPERLNEPFYILFRSLIV